MPEALSEAKLPPRNRFMKMFELYKSFKERDSFAVTSLKTSLATGVVIWKEGMPTLSVMFIIYVTANFLTLWFLFRERPIASRNCKLIMMAASTLYIIAFCWLIVFPWMGWRRSNGWF